MSCTSCQPPSSCLLQGGPDRAADSERRGLREGHENWGPSWAQGLEPVTPMGLCLLIREVGIRAMAMPLDGCEVKCVTMCKPTGSTQEILAASMKPAFSLTLLSSILCFTTDQPSFLSFTFPSSLSPSPSSLLITRHPSLRPSDLHPTPRSSPCSQAPRHHLSATPGSVCPVTGAGQPRLRRVGWWHGGSWSMPGWGVGSSSTWKGRPGRVPGPTLACAPLPALPCELLVSLAPLCLAPETWLQIVGPGGLCPWNWECPIHCKSLHTACSLLGGFWAPPGAHQRGPISFSAPVLQNLPGRSSLREIQPGLPLTTSFRKGSRSVRKT